MYIISVEVASVMKLTCTKSALSHGVQTVARAVSPRSTLAILSNILIDAAEESLTLLATDLEIWIRCVVPAQLESPGSLAVPAHIFADVMNTLPEADVLLSVEDSHLLLKCGKADYTILSLAPEEFPSIPEVSAQVSFTVPQGLLKRFLRMTTFAASREETRAILTGALLEIESEKLSVVATDTHRLALKSSLVAGLSAKTASVIVPARTLNELQRVLRDVDENEDIVKITIGGNQIQFSVDELQIVSRVIDGQFPNYHKVIPKEYERRIVFKVRELLAALKRVAIVARENANKGIFRTQDDTLIVESQSQEVGEANEEVSVTVEGEDTEIAFNVQYVIDVLSALDCEEAVMELTGPLNPGVIRPWDIDTGKVNEEYTYVLMPMQK